MLSQNVQYRVSILNPGIEVTPLKFRGWFRAQAADIDAQALAGNSAHHVCVIRLYLTRRVIAAVGRGKIDRILQDAVDRFATIHRVELLDVDAPLTPGEMDGVRKDVQAEIEALRQKRESDQSDDKPTLH